MKCEKILYAAALTSDSTAPFLSAMEFAKKFDAQLFILHVVEELNPSAVSMLQWWGGEKITKKHYDDFRTASAEKIHTMIREICDRAFKEDPTCSQRIGGIHVVVGYPADEILKKIDELGCDALVMGTHSKGGTSHTFLGSTAERVLRRIRKPTLVIPEA